MRIEFSLAERAAIELEIFDVRGRSVTSLAHGVWPAGKHVAEWSGVARSGEAATSGVYLLLYRYPGGQDRRRLVRRP